MALTNSKEIAVGSTQYGTWYLKLVLTEIDYSIEDNTSQVKRQLYLRCSNTYSSISLDSRSAWIGSNKQTPAYTQSGSEHLLIEDTVTVEHNSDGSGSYSTGFGISSSYVLSGSGSCSLTLTIIPRATTPTLSATQFTMGSKITITMDRASDSFTHNLYFKVGSSAKTSIAQKVGETYDWTDNLYLINWIDQSDRGTVTIYCETYNGDTYIGDKSVTFTGLVPTSVVPKINSINITEATSGLASKFGAYVKEKSTLKVTINATGDYASTIKSYKTTIDGSTYLNSSFTSSALRTSGTLTLTTTVTDTRDRTATKTQQINVINYYTPKVTDFLVQRCDSSGNLADDDTAKYLLFTFGYDIAPVSNKNDKRAVLQYYNSGTWTDIVAYTDVYKKESTNYKTTIEFDVDTSYDVRLVLRDYFNTEDQISISRTVEPTYTLVNYHSSGKGMAIGTVSEAEDTFEVGLSKTILKGTQVNGDLLIANSSGANGVNVLTKINDLTTKLNNVVSNNKSALVNLVYPVGSIYMSVNSTSPATLFGGTWTQLKDRFLLGAGSTYSNGATGGSATHTLTINEMPKHSHRQVGHTTSTSGNYMGIRMVQMSSVNTANTTNVDGAEKTGGDGAHNNMPPYLVVYMWKRTA